MNRILAVLVLWFALGHAATASAKRRAPKPKTSTYEIAELRERELPAAQAPRVAPPPAPLPVEESLLAAVVQENRTSIKRCYQRVLKREPTLKVTKLTTTLRIERTGRVAAVTFAEPAHESDMGPCLAQAIKAWDFPASETGYAFTFPIVLAVD